MALMRLLDDGICGECKHHRKDKDGDWMCMNADSDYYCEWTSYTDGCDEFEKRDID